MAKKRTAKKTGRPSKYTPEIATELCRRIMEGEPLREICADAAMPDKSTVIRWLSNNPAFRDLYAQAREVQSEHMAEEILAIADDGQNDWMERNGEDNPGYALNGEHVQRSRLRVDSRKWLMSKMAPKKYGDRVTQEVTGANGGPIEIAEIRRIVVDPKND